MKKSITKVTLLSSFFLFCNATYAQMAKQTDITYEQLSKHINALMKANSDSAKAELKKEVEIMEKSSDEQFLSLASFVYENALDNTDKSEELRELSAKKFPKGKTARTIAYNKIFADPNKTTSPEEFEQRHKAWVANFPPSLFTGRDLDIYNYPYQTLSIKYAAKNNPTRAIQLVNEVKGKSVYIPYVYSLLNNVPEADLGSYLSIIESAYNEAIAAANSTDEAIKKSTPAQYASALKSQYADVLVANKEFDKAIALIKPGLEASDYKGRSVNGTVETLAKAYVQQQKFMEAFEAIEKAMMANGPSEGLLTVAKDIYPKLNNTSVSFEDFQSNVFSAYKKSVIEKYEKQIIKKEAPQFTLVNRDGKEVSLSDYKGKIVILDFWATWCGPCIMSFPGMQAAVNKYKDDKEVEFLFIDTWQREKNYKELVEEFITSNNYSFHVLFDEMKERSKAVVTAYGVKGIPTKVVIDKEGFIRFESSGGSDNIQEIVTELDAKIELARKG